MRKTGFKIDWTWNAPHNEIDTVWYATTGDGQLLVASNPDFDALIIAETKEEMMLLASFHSGGTFATGPVEIDAKQTSLFSLASRWRWFLYKDKARFLCKGHGWMPSTIGEYPGVQARIAPDPMAMVYACKINGDFVRRGENIVVGGDVHELIEELDQLDLNYEGMEFVCNPLFAMAARHRNVWFRGRVHDLIDTMCRNPKLLLQHGMVSEDAFTIDEEEEK